MLSRKRRADDIIAPNAKRPKVSKHSGDLDSFFDDPTLLRHASELLENGTDGTGFLSGTVFMAWPMDKKAKIIFETRGNDSDGQKQRFDIEFLGECGERLRRSGTRFSATDHIVIALKGASVQATRHKPSKINVLGMELRYTQGVVFRFLKCVADPKQTGTIVNTWTDDGVSDDWFAEPTTKPRDFVRTSVNTESGAERGEKKSHRLLPRSVGASHHHSESERPPDLRDALAKSSKSDLNASSDRQLPSDLLTSASLNAPHSTTAIIKQRAAPPQSAEPLATEDHEPRKLSIRDQRRRRRAENHHNEKKTNGQSSRTASTDTAVSVPSPKASTTLTTLSNPTNDAHVPEEPIAPVKQKASNDTPPLPPPSLHQISVTPPPQIQPTGPLHMKAGFRSANGIYKPLASLTVQNALASVIGIVQTAPEPSRTASGDWSCSVVLYDPSNCGSEEADFISTRKSGLKVNCFTKKYKEWLPQGNPGDVVILRDVKSSSYNGTPTANGYHDKLHWATYTPSTKTMHHGNRGTAPESERLVDGGYNFTPFHYPDDDEKAYCEKLAEWWCAHEAAKMEYMGDVQLVGGGLATAGDWVGSTARKHKLISEAGPRVAPDGYFDCTIQVLYGFQNDNRTYSLYVTDYTQNDGLAVCASDWCLPGLQDRRVLQIEMWDAAQAIGPTMEVGEFYSMKNARMRISGGGYLEAKMCEDKIQHLSPDAAEYNVHLKNLTERKKKWEAEQGLDSEEQTGCRPIEEFISGKYHDCLVEVLHIDLEGKGLPTLYVTDYTEHPKLSNTRFSGPWAEGLAGLIVKIILFGSQITAARSLEPGDFCTIRQLRLQTVKAGDGFQGKLGGAVKLIRKINDVVSLSENSERALESLVRRKEARTRGIQEHSPKNIPKHSTIEEIKGSQKCRKRHRLIAQIVDFSPLNLEDAVVPHCSNCHTDLPKLHRACIKCDDFEHKHVRHSYRFFLRVRDEKGEDLNFAVTDDCALLENLRRVDLNIDKGAALEFRSVISHMMGNCEDVVHRAYHRGEAVELKSPKLLFTLDCWENVDGERVYGFWDYRSIHRS